MSTRLTNLSVPFTFQFNVTAAGTPEQLKVKRRAATIAFVNGGDFNDTITDSGNGFLAAGFQAGDTITVSGSAAGNSGNAIIQSVTAGVITVTYKGAVINEAAGSTITIVAPKAIYDGIGITVKAKNGNAGLIYMGYSTDTALNTAAAGFTLRNNESINLQVTSTDTIWLDATVSGEGVEVIYEKAKLT